MAYGCGRHRDRGSAVCGATVYQDMSEVEDALVSQLQEHVLGEAAMAMALDQIRDAITAQLPQHEADISALETELAATRAEQRRLAKAVAMADNIPELVSELEQRSSRIRNLDAQVIAARRTPDELRAMVDRIEATVRTNVADLHRALRDRDDLRHVFQAMFPTGLTFTPARTPDGVRQIWKIEGDADLGQLAEPSRESRFRLRGDPNGI